jgi:hypothetical protein
MAIKPGVDALAKDVCRAIRDVRKAHEAWIPLDRVQGRLRLEAERCRRGRRLRGRQGLGEDRRRTGAQRAAQSRRAVTDRLMRLLEIFSGSPPRKVSLVSDAFRERASVDREIPRSVARTENTDFPAKAPLRPAAGKAASYAQASIH